MKAKNIELSPVKGFKDIVGIRAIITERIIDICKKIAMKYGAVPIQTPIVERENLFVKSVGETSDIVNKEIFRLQSTKTDGDDTSTSLILRPEQTSSIMRCAMKDNIQNNHPKRFFSYGPMFRHENPQKGRWRQFTQFSFECLRENTVISDVELILFTGEIIQEIIETFKFQKEDFLLKVNFIGKSKDREKYSIYLKDKVLANSDLFSDSTISKARYNPLRILDSKDPEDIKNFHEFLYITEFLDEESKERMDNVLNLLSSFNIEYKLDPYLMRGLDYYNDLVIEWEINHSELTKSTVIGGGRYDYLSQIFSEKVHIPAIGFSCGIDRLVDYIMLLKKKEDLQKILKNNKVVICAIDCSNNYTLKVLNHIRIHNDAILGPYSSLKKNLSYVNDHHLDFHPLVIIIGTEEEKLNSITVKNMFSKDPNMKQKLIALKDWSTTYCL